VKRYEGLFILNISGKEEGIKEAIDKISAEIAAAGGRVETVQKMDKRNFTRVANKKHSSGFYVNVIFESKSETLAPLHHRLGLNEEILRVIFTHAPPQKEIKT